MNIKGGLVNDRSYLLTPGLSLSWYRSQTEKAVFVFFFLFQMWTDQDTQSTDWFPTCQNGCVSTSDPHLHFYLFMFSCPSADFFILTRLSCSCTDTSVLMWLHLSNFLCWVHLGFCLFACSEVRSQTWPVAGCVTVSLQRRHISYKKIGF